MYTNIGKFLECTLNLDSISLGTQCTNLFDKMKYKYSYVVVSIEHPTTCKKYILWVNHDNNSSDRTRCRRNLLPICFYLLQREKEKDEKSYMWHVFSTQTELLLSRQITSHIERNVQSEYISIPGMILDFN